MFSGIIEEKAEVEKITKTLDGSRLTLRSKISSKDSKIGDSISVNGTCLTVVEKKGNSLTFDVMDETIERTNLRRVSSKDVVNLERSLKFGDKVSGHFVTGHIDCVGKVDRVARHGSDHEIEIEFPKEKTPYVVEKGSVALDGVSLTIAKLNGNYMKICLIPFTMEFTNLGSKKVGDLVNIEFDILGKYSLNKAPVQKNKIDSKFLKEHGFL